MRVEWVVIGWILAGVVQAAEAPMPAPVNADVLVTVSVAAEAAYQTTQRRASRPAVLDEAVFTEISAFSIPELAIRLPDDQQE